MPIIPRCNRLSIPAGGLILAVIATIPAGVWFASADARPQAAITRTHRAYCTRHHPPRGCVKVPKSALRPSHTNQQGSSALTPRDVENGGGLGGGPGDHGAVALDWARSQLGQTQWAWRCERFVEEAQGTRFQFDTAAAAADKLRLHGGPITDAPAGSLVFFAPDAANRRYGHVGLSLGDGRMISALDTVQITDVRKSAYWRGIYVGWAPAPDSWPGRIPPPPGSGPLDPALSVRISAPAAGSTQSGVVALIASASGDAGVDFDAYYATDPRDASTRGWHTLGAARKVDGFWEYEWNTAGVPDQGFGAWGTVNIAALLLDERGQRTGTRDYRRISIDNTTGSTPPPGITPPPVTPPPEQTYPETTGGAAHTWSDYQSAGGTEGPPLTSNRTVGIACRVQGFRVADGNTWWYRIADNPWNNGFYVSADAFYNNGQTSGSLQGTPFFDPVVPVCP